MTVSGLSGRLGSFTARLGATGIFLLCLLLAACGNDETSFFAPNAAAGPKQASDTHPTPAADYDAFLKKNGPPPSIDRKTRLGVILPFFGFRFVQLQQEGMLASSRELGGLIVSQAGATDSDEQGQRTRSLEILALNPAAMLVSPLTRSNLYDLFVLAEESRIPIVSVNEITPKAPSIYVGSDHYRTGLLAALLLRERLPSGGKIAVLQSRKTSWSSSRRTLGFMEGLSDERFQVVAQPECFGDMQTAIFSAGRILDEHPDLAGFFAVTDNLSLGVVRAVHEAHASKRVLVVGAGGSETAIDEVEAGRMAALIDCRPFDIGRAAVDIAARLLNDKPVPRVMHVAPRIRTAERPEGVVRHAESLSATYIQMDTEQGGT